MNVITGIRPLQFVHILDLTSNITRVECGPQTLVLQTNERLAGGPFPFVIVPPGSYCKIRNPCKNYVPGKQCELQFGHYDVRFHKEPFPLYPGEVLVGAEDFGVKSSDFKKALKTLPVIGTHCAIQLEAAVDHKDGDIERIAGDRWQLEGPITFYPTPYTDIVEFVQPKILTHGEALRLRAVQKCTDRTGKKRVTGEEWLVGEPGAYLPGVFEEVVSLEQAYTLKQEVALHLTADQNTVDSLGKKRQAGDEWLITSDDLDTLVPRIGVTIMKEVLKTILGRNQWCVVLNPVGADSKPQLGKKEVRTGVASFFLHPGESLEKGIQNSFVLEEHEALVLQANEEFVDTKGEKKKVLRKPGERWMINGPCNYIPTTEVTVVDKRKALSLIENDGVYIRDTKTGFVRLVMGPESYMLTEDEVLFSKELPPNVEEMLLRGGGMGSDDIRKIAYFEQSIDPKLLHGRDKTRVVTYRCPHNTACQVYNYQKRTARVIFGPDLVVLGPHENFNALSLSAGKPKITNAMKSLALMLGPDFITDIITVETSDHARLSIKLAFNNYFQVDKTQPEKLFAVPDFIGFACSQLGSRIRGAVAGITFDEFHKHSADIIHYAVLGTDAEGKLNKTLKFEENNLVVSNVDIQSIEPVDVKMRDSLQKSVQMAIEISTRSIEASASHEAKRVEQISRGQLERQKLENEKQSEKERAILLDLKATTAAVESTGQAVAEAQARAESMKIECESEIEGARLKALAAHIEHQQEISSLGKVRSAENAYLRSMNNLEINKDTRLSEIEVKSFSSMVQTLGTKTITEIANSGHNAQLRMLEAIGLETTLITDGNNPINLFNTANGLVAQPEGGQ